MVGLSTHMYMNQQQLFKQIYVYVQPFNENKQNMHLCSTMDLWEFVFCQQYGIMGIKHIYENNMMEVGAINYIIVY